LGDLGGDKARGFNLEVIYLAKIKGAWDKKGQARKRSGKTTKRRNSARRGRDEICQGKDGLQQKRIGSTKTIQDTEKLALYLLSK
jgi:hypothetical protein